MQIVQFKKNLPEDYDKNNFHLRINPKEKYFYFTYQEGALLRVAGYDRKGLYLEDRFDLLNEEKIDFSKFFAGDKNGHGTDFTFELDGKEITFRRYLPPEAIAMGSDTWRYHLRWKHVWGNYYLITVNRGENIIREELMTEKDGHDLLPILGESHLTMTREDFEAGYGGGGVKVFSYFLPGYPIYLQLLPVKEEDLPADFPKDIIRWIP